MACTHRLKLTLLSFILALLNFKIWSYPNFIGYQYNSCLTCHYNPFGNGPLTDYGRAVGATAISDRLFYPNTYTDDEIGKNSGFLYSKSKNEWFRPSLDYRGLYIVNGYQTTQEETEYIHMQASASVVLRLGPKSNRDKIIVVGEIGYAPEPKTTTLDKQDKYRSREHYVGYRINQNWGIYAGLMDKVFGIRLPDHTLANRQPTALAMNDQSHGFVVHYTQPEFELGGNVFIGNLAQDADIRQKGLSATGEYTVTNKTRVGGSLLTSESKYVSLFLKSLHVRSGFGKGNSIMVEVGQIDREEILRSTERQSNYVMAQNVINLRRGLNVINTLEYFNADTENDNKVMMFGPGLQWFPVPGVELRGELYNRRVFAEEAVAEDTWDLLGQMHLWF